MNIHPKKKGERTQIIIMAELIKRDKSISLPFGDNQRYDLIIDDNGKLIRAQCKTGWLRNGTIVFKTSSTRTNTKGTINRSYKGQIDCFLVYCEEINELYLIPIDKATSVNMRLRVKQPKTNQGFKINWAEKYKI